jgi:NADPH2:quinone reductase
MLQETIIMAKNINFMPMKAIWIAQKGGPEVLELREIERPEPTTGEVLIRVKAAGLNRSDIYSRKSMAYGENDAKIPGLEVAGIIESCGPGVTRWKPGDAVCALVNGGGYAEYVTAPAGQCLPVPKGWSLEEAATLPETVLTVWSNVFRTCRLQAGENFLVHGGSGGIGITAIQLGVACGANVYTTAGTDEKCRFCESLGAIKAVNYRTQDFGMALQDIGIDVVLDITGGDFTPVNLRVLRDDGRIVYINSVRGKQAIIDISVIMNKRLVITGSMLKPRDTAFKSALTAEVEAQVWPLIERGAIKPVIFRVLPLAAAAEAQQLMEDGGHIGKILLRP